MHDRASRRVDQAPIVRGRTREGGRRMEGERTASILFRNGGTISQITLRTLRSADSRTRDLHMINNHRPVVVIGATVIAIFRLSAHTFARALDRVVCQHCRQLARRSVRKTYRERVATADRRAVLLLRAPEKYRVTRVSRAIETFAHEIYNRARSLSLFRVPHRLRVLSVSRCDRLVARTGYQLTLRLTVASRDESR